MKARNYKNVKHSIGRLGAEDTDTLDPKIENFIYNAVSKWGLNDNEYNRLLKYFSGTQTSAQYDALSNVEKAAVNDISRAIRIKEEKTIFAKMYGSPIDRLIAEVATKDPAAEGEAEDAIDDFITDLENKNPNFIRFALEGKTEEQFYKDYTSGKYDWKFIVVSDDNHNAIEKLDRKIDMIRKADMRWKEYSTTDNIDQAAAVLYKKK